MSNILTEWPYFFLAQLSSCAYTLTFREPYTFTVLISNICEVQLICDRKCAPHRPHGWQSQVRRKRMEDVSLVILGGGVSTKILKVDLRSERHFEQCSPPPKKIESWI